MENTNNIYEEDDDLMLEQPRERYEHYRFTVDKGQKLLREFTKGLQEER